MKVYYEALDHTQLVLGFAKGLVNEVNPTNTGSIGRFCPSLQIDQPAGATRMD
jgi:hypothetical protein